MNSKKINCGITGYTGILGSEVVKRNSNFKYIKFKGNIIKKDDIKNWLKKNNIEIILHLAALVPTNEVKRNPVYANKVNYIGTKNLVNEILKHNKIKWFFFASTSHVYNYSTNNIKETYAAKPQNFYGKTKLRAETYIQSKLKNQIPYCIGRIFSFTHKKQNISYVVPNIVKKAKSKKKNLVLKNLGHYRDFISTNDICRAIKILYQKRAVGIYNIASGEKILISDIAEIIFKKLNKKYIIQKNLKKTCLIANIEKIRGLNWRPKDDISKILDQLF
jgi:nucleoside-diphosphate-sugar epimerase